MTVYSNKITITALPGQKYNVEFNITGGMRYIPFTLTFNGMTFHGFTDINGNAQIPIYNVSAGTYTWSISSGDAKFSPSGGTINVSGNNMVITQNITASPYNITASSKYPVVFNITGAIPNIYLRFIFDDMDVLIFTDANGDAQVPISSEYASVGTHTWSIHPWGSNCEFFPSSGTLNVVDNKFITQNITASCGYTVVFNITGAAPDIYIGLDLGGLATAKQTDANGNAQITLYGVSAGTYNWNISSVYKCNFYPSSGTLNVSGNNMVITQNITASCMGATS